jgi:hypothetical protein
MRLLIVSSTYPRDAQDWRGRFIADMVEHLAREPGLECTLWAPPGARPADVSDFTEPAEARWLDALAERGGIASALRGNPMGGLRAAAGLLRRLRRAYRRASDIDVAHVNWLQNALPLAGTRLPALVTVLGSDFGLLRLPGMTPALRRVFARRRCILAPNAQWMAETLKQRFGDVVEVRPIPFGVADAWFSAQRMPDAAGSRVWLAVTRLTRGKLGTLLEWGAAPFAESGRALHLFGPMQEPVAVPSWVTYHGPADPVALREHWFPRAAGLVTLSAHDEGRPQVVLEAMAAGLPVIVSDLPAHRDVVTSANTGLIVRSEAEFASALDALEAPSTNERVGRAARSWIAEHVGTWTDAARRYADAYRLLAGDGPLMLAQGGAAGREAKRT